MVRSGRQNFTTTFCARPLNWNPLPATSGRTRFVRAFVGMPARILCPARKRSIGKNSVGMQIVGSRRGRNRCRALRAKTAWSPPKPGQSPALHENRPGAFASKAAGFDSAHVLDSLALAPILPDKTFHSRKLLRIRCDQRQFAA